MVKKVGLPFVKKTHLLKMLPTFYQTHLQNNLSLAEYLLLQILINLLQSIKKVSLETLATSLPIPILFESRRKKIQRFLSRGLTRKKFGQASWLISYRRR